VSKVFLVKLIIMESLDTTSCEAQAVVAKDNWLFEKLKTGWEFMLLAS